MDRKDHDKREPEDLERFRFELAEELGLIERADSGRKSRATVLKSPARSANKESHANRRGRI